MNLSLRNLQTKIDDILYLIDYYRWMWNQAWQPRQVGTIFVKYEEDEIVHYEVIAHTCCDEYPQEMIDEIHREKRQ